MKPVMTLEVKDRKAWRSWLARNHAREKEVWLVYRRKSSGKARIPYNDAVEEALCYGWIDSIQKGIDGERFTQRFSPRRKGSPASEINRQRILKLIAEKKMTKAGLEAVAGVFKADAGRLQIAKDILKPLKSDRGAWENFNRFPDSYKRIRIAFLESRRKHGNGAFRKSLAHFVKMTGKGKRFGYVEQMDKG